MLRGITYWTSLCFRSMLKNAVWVGSTLGFGADPQSFNADDTATRDSTITAVGIGSGHKAHKLIKWAFDCHKSKNDLFAVSMWHCHISVPNPIKLTDGACSSYGRVCAHLLARTHTYCCIFRRDYLKSCAFGRGFLIPNMVFLLVTASHIHSIVPMACYECHGHSYL